MVKPWSLVAVLAVASLSSCGLSPEKEAVIAKARSIREFPVPRATLIASLGLESQPGKRVDGAIRDRWIPHSETWQHPTGLTITAYDREFLPAVTRESIDEILNNRPHKPSSLVPESATHAPRKSFYRFSVRDGRRVLFQSDESLPDWHDVKPHLHLH